MAPTPPGTRPGIVRASLFAPEGSAERSDARRRASRHGTAGEQVVEGCHRIARLQHVARMDKVPTPMRLRQGRWTFGAKSTVDFVGFLKDGSGRFVAVETKTVTDSARFAVGEVTEHQAAYLTEVLESGGLAFVAVVFGEALGAELLRAETYLVPWGWLRGHTSVTRSELARAGFSAGPGSYLQRYLSSPSTTR